MGGGLEEWSSRTGMGGDWGSGIEERGKVGVDG